MTLNPSATDVYELAVNLDDQTGQVIGDALETLLAEGALDVWTTAIGMKKNRPAVMLSLLVLPQDKDRLSLRVLELTGSFGVRSRPCSRLVLDRKHVTATCPLGQFRVKIGLHQGRILVAQPELEDVRALARAGGVPLRDALAHASAAAQALRH